MYVNNADSVGWIVVAVIFEGAGVIPLLLALVGFLRLMLVLRRSGTLPMLINNHNHSHALDFSMSERFRKSIVLLRVVFLAGIGLLVGGSSLIGNYKDPPSVKVGLNLAKAGYIVFVCVLAALMVFAGVLRAKMRQALSIDSEKVCLSRIWNAQVFTSVADTCSHVYFDSFLGRPDGICLPFRVCLESKMESTHW